MRCSTPPAATPSILSSSVARHPRRSRPRRPTTRYSRAVSAFRPRSPHRSRRSCARLTRHAASARGAAVAGEPFRLGLAARISGLEHERALELIDGAINAGLVRAVATPGHFVFRHPLLRRAVYEGSGEGWRLAAHGRAAAELEAQGAGPGRACPPRFAQRRAGDGASIELLREAANRTLDTRADVRCALAAHRDRPRSRRRGRASHAAARRARPGAARRRSPRGSTGRDGRGDRLAGDDVDVEPADRPRRDRSVAGAALGGDRAAREGRAATPGAIAPRSARRSSFACCI